MRAVSMTGGTARFAMLCLIVGCFVLPAAAEAATVWNVSHVAGAGNYTGLLNLNLGGIVAGDTIRIWGDGAPYEGGITIDVPDVTIERWEGSPARPIITNTSHTAPAITVEAGGVTLQGLNISGNILDSNHDHGAGVRVTGTKGAHLQGFTVTGCVFTGNEVTVLNGAGGAVYLQYVDGSRITDTVFTGNTADRPGSGYGGGAYFEYSDNAALTDTTFTGNTAGYHGGGAYFWGSADAALTDTTFTGNTADWYGGGAYFASSAGAALTNTTFTDNTAGRDGGGAYFTASAGAALTDTTFTGNTADLYGGGAWFAASDNAALTDTTFTGNTAGWGGGGAWFTASDNAALTDTTFTGNTAVRDGGGAYFWGSADAALTDTTFTGNTAGWGGGGAHFAASDNAALTDTTFTGNTAGSRGGGAWFAASDNAAIINCRFANPTNIYAASSSAVLNGTRSTGTNIAGGPYLGGNLWLTDPTQNISEWGTDADFDGICDETLTIAGFGTDSLPLVYGGGRLGGGTAAVDSAPAGASIHLDGAEIARTTNTSLYLPVGDHDLTVTLDGYVTPDNQTVTILAGQTVPVSFDLDPVCGSLAVSSVPEGARIVIDGTATGSTTNATLTDVLPGNHTVTVTLDGYVTPDNQTVTILAGQTVPVSFDLDPVCGSLAVSSVPEGARIVIDGTATGSTTNATLTDVLPGNHTVTVTLDGYVTPDNRTVTILANETTAVSFTLEPVPTPTPTARSHGSSGGRSDLSAGSASDIPAGGRASLAVEGTAIYAVTVTAAEDIPEILITIEKKGLPSGTDAPAGAVYECDEVILYRTTDAAIAGATLNFTVPKAWLAERGFAPENVVLYRYQNGTWQALPTVMTGEDASRYFFAAESPGFSLFAIAAEGEVVTSPTGEPTAQPTAAPTPVSAAAAAESTPTPQQSPVPWELAALAAGMAYILKKRRL